MKDKEVRILSTRPLDGALIEKAAYNNIKLETISYIEVRKVVSGEVANRIGALAREKATVVFTSMHALEIVVEIVPVDPVMPDWKIYCIGGATFTLVKKYWPYENVVHTARNASELAKQIVTDGLEKVVFFCGNKRRDEMPLLLAQHNIDIEELMVYETIETPAKVQYNYNGILFFSPSAVCSFFSNNQVPASTILFALGNTTANSIKQFSTNSIIVSDFPAKDQLVDKAIQYFNEKSGDID